LADIHGVSLFELYPPNERERVATLCDAADRTGQVDFEADRWRTDGSIFPARIHTTSVRGADGEIRYRIVTSFDISSQRELEAELHQSQRLEAIGQLTAGVAHDFNNLLQGIMANLELMDDDIYDRPVARRFLHSVLRLAEHGGDLTRHLLSFGRQQFLRPAAIDLSAFFAEFNNSLSRTLDPRIQVTITAGPGLPRVWADATHLHTALLNLAINARDAMPSGGGLRIEAFCSSAADAGGREGAGAEHMVVVRVSDTGTGMAPDVLAKVCEPFFTTKGLNGTGLGLSMVYGFAKQSRGDLRISSEQGKGTCVQLCLPLASRQGASLCT
jgi:signal transduction histidine kinase